MTVSLEELNALPAKDAAELLHSCCGAAAWVSAMVARRPYKSEQELLDAADNAWKSATRNDWREAFEHHPRIGENQSTVQQAARARDWALIEQSRARLASSSVHDQMSLVNRAYEKKFGYIYVVFATGKTARELLDMARQRLKNDPETEIRVAGEEQRKITQLRLKKLIGTEPA